MISRVSDVAADMLPYSGKVLQGLDLGVSFVLLSILFAIIFRFMPDVHIGWRNVGLGAVFLIDHRNNTAYPSKGFYLEVSGYHFGKAFGSDFRYNNINFEFNRYYGLGNDRVLATNTMLRLNEGDVPVQRLATAGGDKILRGYARNRFHDDHFAGTQAEYRFPLFWRLGGAAFAGIGDVFDKPKDISFSTVKYSIGTGLRYAIRPDQKLNSRLDVGYGREGFNIYLMIGEAF